MSLPCSRIATAAVGFYTAVGDMRDNGRLGAFQSRPPYILHELEGLSCGFLSLGESWCDTTTDVGRLMLTIMGSIAEFERNLIRKRCDEGIGRAKRKGVTFGRKRKLDKEMVRVCQSASKIDP